MGTSSENEDERKANRLFRGLVIGIAVLVIGHAAAVLFATWPVSNWTVAAAGTFADSFGWLTALFSGVAFAGLIWTILLQRAELRLQRRELVESRRQAILTRLMTLTQNQISTYRAEIAPLQFEDVTSPDRTYGPHEMCFTMLAILHDLAGKPEAERATNNPIIDWLWTVAKSYRAYLALIEGLARCCKANHYIVLNEVLEPAEAQDIKNLMFAELPTGLLDFVPQLETVLRAFLHKQGQPTVPNTFDPLRNLLGATMVIVEYHALEFTAEQLAHDRKNKWAFAP